MYGQQTLRLNPVDQVNPNQTFIYISELVFVTSFSEYRWTASGSLNNFSHLAPPPMAYFPLRAPLYQLTAKHRTRRQLVRASWSLDLDPNLGFRRSRLAKKT